MEVCRKQTGKIRGIRPLQAPVFTACGFLRPPVKSKPRFVDAFPEDEKASLRGTLGEFAISLVVINRQPIHTYFGGACIRPLTNLLGVSEGLVPLNPTLWGLWWFKSMRLENAKP